MMGRRKEKEKSPQSPVSRFLGRNSAPVPKGKVASVSVDGAQNGAFRLRYYGQTDGVSPERIPNGHGKTNLNICGNPALVGTSTAGSYSTFGVPSQPQPTQSHNVITMSTPPSITMSNSASSSSSGGSRYEYRPPQAANLLSFQMSPVRTPSCHDDQVIEEDDEDDSVRSTTSFSNGNGGSNGNGSNGNGNGVSTSSNTNMNSYSGHINGGRSLIPVAAQIHARPNSISSSGEQSKSEEALREGRVNNGQKEEENIPSIDDEPLSDGIVREKDFRRHSTGETLVAASSPSPQRTQSPYVDQSPKSGQRSPGSQSLMSITSTATVISNAGGMDHHRSGGKQTLGDILGQIEQRSRHLLSKTNFTQTEDVLHDLQYLAHQSRYSSDAAIKRRIVQKLIECNVVQLFVKVFKSVHTVDYMGEHEDATTQGAANSGSGSNPNAPPQENGQTKSSAESVGSGASSSNNSIDGVATASNSSHGSSGNHPAGVYPGGAAQQQQAKPMGKPPLATNSSVDKQSHSNCTEAMKNLRAIITILWNATEKLGQLPVCEDCVHQGVVSLILGDMGDSTFMSTELGKDQNRLYLVKGYLGILQNILRFYSDGREAFRSAGAVKILQQYLKSSLLMVKTRTIMLLSYVMSESENDIINSSDKNLGFVVKMLQSAVEGDNHYSKKYGLWAVEIAAGLNRLASFESNKERIVTRGVLPLYSKLLLPPCTDEESLVAAKGFWIFSFNQEARRLIKADPECMNGLHQLETENGREEIRKMAAGALWILNDKNVPSPAVMENAAKQEDSSTAHVLVSYQWTSKHMVSRMRERLRSAGYKVCTDVEPLQGSTIMEAMADVVNKSAVVLLCMSQKYKDSPSCRTEAEYARDANKYLIPLRLQPKYNPDGWLADMIGSKLSFDLSRPENIEKMIPNLIREMGNRGRVRSMESLAAMSTSASVLEEYRHSPMLRRSVSPLPPPPQMQEQCIQVSPEEADRVLASWSREEVTRWLKSKNVYTDKLKQMDGDLLVQVRKLRRDAPEMYHTMLRSDLKFDFLTILKFNSALEKL